MKDDAMWVLLGLGALFLWQRSQPSAAAVAAAVPSGTVALPVTDVPSTVSATDRGGTNPLSALMGWIGQVMRPQVTLPGNAPVSPALPAGPGGTIAASQGGNPGTPPIVVVAGEVPFYSSLYDTPGAYFDPISGTFHPH